MTIGCGDNVRLFGEKMTYDVIGSTRELGKNGLPDVEELELSDGRIISAAQVEWCFPLSEQIDRYLGEGR